MAAGRLTDNQKRELVERYRLGHSSVELAALYGCSPNTVSRTVKAALDPAEYAQLKQQRSRASGQPTKEVPVVPEVEDRFAAEVVPDRGSDQTDCDSGQSVVDDQAPQAAAALAIDDADDFGDDDLLGDGDDDDPEDVFVAVPVLPLTIGSEPVQVRELVAAVLPDSLYLLVDKTVELQAIPLREFSELGQLPPDEEDRQALQLFANPRQAKRQCGRSQRVIKMPDPEVLVRHASYLQVKGISRLVLEGSLYALPGS